MSQPVPDSRGDDREEDPVGGPVAARVVLDVAQIVATRVWFNPNGVITPQGESVFGHLRAGIHDQYRQERTKPLAYLGIYAVGWVFLMIAGHNWGIREHSETTFWIGFWVLAVPFIGILCLGAWHLIRKAAVARDTHLAHLDRVIEEMRRVARLDDTTYTALLKREQRRAALRNGGRLLIKGAFKGLLGLGGLPVGDLTDLT